MHALWLPSRRWIRTQRPPVEAEPVVLPVLGGRAQPKPAAGVRLHRLGFPRQLEHDFLGSGGPDAECDGPVVVKKWTVGRARVDGKPLSASGCRCCASFPLTRVRYTAGSAGKDGADGPDT